jgi:C1A family cysteine protease
MRNKKLSFIFVFLWTTSLLLPAQTLVSVNKAITQDTLLTTIQRNSVSSKSVIASGQAVFSSKSGFVRILLSDDYGYDLLVYESSPLVAVNGIDNFSSEAIETVEIPSRLALTKIRVEIKNAQLRNLSVDVSAISPSRTQQQIRTDRIALINSNLRSQNALWVAGETSISQMSYQEKKEQLGEKLLDLTGFEYYAGGIYEIYSDSLTASQNTQTPTRSNFVSKFDWRNRHGRNWHTSVKNQFLPTYCNSCWAFAAVGAVEAYTRLYYNQLLDIDLSEQDVVSCTDKYSCIKNGAIVLCNTCANGGQTSAALNYIKNTGVVNETCYPNTGSDSPCSNKCPNPSERIKIGGTLGFSTYPQTEESLKKMIIKYGPMTAAIPGHAMTLSGFGTINAGDSVQLATDSWAPTIIIQANDPRIGQTYWIFKNSCGTGWGNSGWAYIITNNFSTDIAGAYVNHILAILPPITSINYSNANIVCEDRDGDGYYFWGIGPKPATCPSCAPDEPDGDDSNPNLGPMDEYGNCAAITPLVDIVTTTQTWNTNRTICRNVTIPSGVTLTITATVFMQPVHKITIQNGGKLILSGGTIDNASVVALSGSKLTILNNGKILLGSYDNLDIQLGAEFDMDYGEVSLK